MRWGLGRNRYRVAPGLYAVGRPESDSPVLVSANYKMSFDSLRRELATIDAWILVLDTKGINVWCAAGKGTFGTTELVDRVKSCRLEEIVEHRRLIVPQLGAVGVAAHDVKRGCGFQVIYGPVRASDLPEFLAANLVATPSMRRVSFGLKERAVLTPVELTILWRKIFWGGLLLLLLGGIGPEFFSWRAALERGGAAIAAALAGVVAGAVVTPILLPWLPGRSFSGKGAVAGAGMALAVLPFGTFTFGGGLSVFLGMTAIASFVGMNFTGSSTYTSPTGVEKEMRRAIPLQSGALIAALILWVGGAF